VLHHDGVLRYTARTWRKRHRLYATLPAAPELAQAQVVRLATPEAVVQWLADVAPRLRTAPPATASAGG
jgi:hypothetical protein